MSVRLREDLAVQLAVQAREKGYASLNAYVNEICRQHLFEKASWKQEALNRKAEEKKLLNILLMPGALGSLGPVESVVGYIHHTNETMVFIEYEVERGPLPYFILKIPIEDIKAWEEIDVLPVDIEKASEVQSWLKENREANRERVRTDGAHRRDWVLPTRFSEPYTSTHAATLRTLGLTYRTEGLLQSHVGAETCRPPEEYWADEARKRATKAVAQGRTIRVPMVLEQGKFSVCQIPWEDIDPKVHDGAPMRILGFGFESKGAEFGIDEFRIGGSANLLLDPITTVPRNTKIEVTNLRANPILIQPNQAWFDLRFSQNTAWQALNIEAYLLLESLKATTAG